MQVVESGFAIEPEVVSASDIGTMGQRAENYESVLVRVENVEVTDAALGFGDFEIDSSLVVDDFFFPAIEPNPGTTFDFITGVLLFSFEQFRLSPRTEADAQIGSGGVGATDATIYEIQQGMIPEATKVRVSNVIATTPMNAEGKLFFAQEQGGGDFSGIAVFVNEEGFQIQPGDVVTIEARYEEYYDLSELVVSSAADITRVNAGQVPAPELVGAAAVATGGARQEALEGVLVQVADVTVTAEVDMFGEFQVDGVLQVEDLFLTTATGWPNPPVDTAYVSITGVMNFGFEQAKLAPRTAADVQE